MITLLRFDSIQVEVKSSRILRVRPSSAVRDEAGSSRIDGLITPYYQNTPEAIAASVHSEIATFTSLQQPDGMPVWFDGAKASGPFVVPKVNRSELIHSALVIGTSVQLVRNTPDEVFQLLSNMGGNAEPPVKPPYDEKVGGAGNLAIMRHRIEPDFLLPIWDADLYVRTTI